MKTKLFIFGCLVLVTLLSPRSNAVLAANIGTSNSATTAQFGLNQGLIGYWTFDGKNTNWATGSTTDSSGNGRYGSLLNMSTTSSVTPGRFGQGFRFATTSSSHVNVSTMTGAYTANSSVSVWVNLAQAFSAASVSGHIGLYGAYADDNNRFAMYFSKDGGHEGKVGSVLVIGGVVYRVYTTQTSWNPNTWYHFVFTSGAGGLKIFVNGLPAAITVVADTTSGYNSVAPTESYIGVMRHSTYPGGKAGYLVGKVDDVRVYNRALSATEVKQLYAQGGGAEIAKSATASSTTPGNLNQGLIGYWTLDGKNTNWATGKTNTVAGTNHGTVVRLSTTTAVTPGKVGQAFTFASTSTQYVTMGDVHDIGTADTTMALWMRPSRVIDQTGFIFGKRDSSTGEQYAVFMGTLTAAGGINASKKVGTLFFSGGALADSQGYATVNDVVDGKWHHIIVTRSGTTVKMYVDGVSAPLTAVLSGAVVQNVDSTGALNIGWNNGTNYFNGSVDDVRLYSRALSAAEAKLLYQQTAAIATSNTATTTPFGLNSGLVGYWPFDGKNTNWATGKTNDVASTNHGSLTGMSTTTTPAPGKIGQGLKFDGSNDYVFTSTPDPVLSDYSISVWVKSNVVDNAVHGIAGWSEAADSDRFTIYQRGTTNNYAVLLDTGTIINGIIVEITPAVVGRWTHLTVTLDRDGFLKSYVDGVLVDSTSVSAGSAESLDPAYNFAIGTYRAAGGGAASYWNGLIDDVRIYSRALTATEVRQLYSASR